MSIRDLNIRIMLKVLIIINIKFLKIILLYSVKKFNFLTTFLLYRVVLFIQQPGSNELNGTIYLAPFKWQLWIAIMAAMLLLVFFLSLSFYMAYNYTKIEQRHYSLWESLFSVFACFCTQGNKWNFKWTSLLSSLHACIHASMYVVSFMNVCKYVNMTSDIPCT